MRVIVDYVTKFFSPGTDIGVMYFPASRQSDLMVVYVNARYDSRWITLLFGIASSSQRYTLNQNNGLAEDPPFH